MKALLFDLDGTLVDRDGTLFGDHAARDMSARLTAACQLTPELAVVDLVRHLAQQFRIAVVSNGNLHLQRTKLQRAGLAPWVHAVAISGQVGVRKPDAGLFHEACRLLGCRLADVQMMVGDDTNCDVMGAAALGLPTCWVSRGRDWPLAQASPDHTVASVLDLPEVLQCSMPVS